MGDLEKKSFFSLIFFVVWGIWYEKHMIFHEILRPQKVWSPGGGGTLLEFLSKKRGITVPYVRSKLCVFWNSHLKFFWLFFEKSRFLTFSYLWENHRKGTKKTDFGSYSSMGDSKEILTFPFFWLSTPVEKP